MRSVGSAFGLLVFLASLSLPLSAHAGSSVVLRWPHSQPPDHPYHIALNKVAEVVREKTEGRVQIQIYPAGQLGNDPAILEGMAMGTLEMGIMGGALLSPWYPPISVFDANYVFSSLDHMYKFTETPIAQEMFDALRNRRGIRVLDTWYYGTRQVTTKNKPVKTPDDLKGLKIRVPNTPLTIANVRAMGANATPMAFTEVYMGLSQGVMDGQENPLPTIVGNKFFEVQKFLNLTEHSVQATFPLISEKAFQSLSPNDRTILQETVKGMRNAYNKMVLDREESDLRFLKERGMTVVTADVEVFRAKALKEIPPQFEAQWGKGLYERIQQTK
jgi:tripartite ATP-independent transporter DctP family solute receptor